MMIKGFLVGVFSLYVVSMLSLYITNGGLYKLQQSFSDKLINERFSWIKLNPTGTVGSAVYSLIY